MPSVIREYQGSFSGAEGHAEYQIHYEITSRGYPGRGPSLSQPGEPPEPPEWNITKVEQAIYLSDRTEPQWVDVRKLGLQPEAVASIESWAEDQIDPDDVYTALRDEADAQADYQYEAYRDRMTGYDD